MSDQDYGFTSMDAQVSKQSPKATQGQTEEARVDARDMALSSWWMAEIQRRVRRCIVRPDLVNYQADLNKMLDQYRQAVAEGAVTAPRMSLD